MASLTALPRHAHVSLRREGGCQQGRCPGGVEGRVREGWGGVRGHSPGCRALPRGQPRPALQLCPVGDRSPERLPPSVQGPRLASPPPEKETTYQFSFLTLGPCSTREALQDRGQGSELLSPGENTRARGRAAPMDVSFLSVEPPSGTHSRRPVLGAWPLPPGTVLVPPGAPHSPAVHWDPSLLGRHGDRPLPAGDLGGRGVRGC